jgi:peptidase M48-like protein
MRLRPLLVLIGFALSACAAGSADEMFAAATMPHGSQSAGDAASPTAARVNAIVSKLALAANPACAVPSSDGATAHIDTAALGPERLENFGPASPDGGRLARPMLAAEPVNCSGFAVVVTSAPGTFASTNGRRIQIARGFVEFARADSELAFVIAHEMAHVLKGHQAVNDVSVRYAQELDADRLGFQILIRAGYDPAGAIDLLRRMQVANGASMDPKYPSFNARADILQREEAQLVSSPTTAASP